MESKENIVNSALDQIILRALYDIEQSEAPAREAAEKLSRLYDSLVFDKKLDSDVRARVSQYIQQSVAAAAFEFRQIYLQGAKDSIIALRELGVIK